MVDLSVFLKFIYPGFIIPRFRQDGVVDNLNGHHAIERHQNG